MQGNGDIVPVIAVLSVRGDVGGPDAETADCFTKEGIRTDGEVVARKRKIGF